MSSMIPCQNPKLCRVQSHKPGTNALCKTSKTGQSRAMKLLASGAVKIPGVRKRDQTAAIERLYKDRRVVTVKMIEEGREHALKVEGLLITAKDPNIINVANTVSPGPSKNPSFRSSTAAALYELGYGVRVDPEEAREQMANAVAAVQMLRTMDQPGAAENIKGIRVASLARDLYVREHCDQLRYYGEGATEIDDLANLIAISDKSLERRMSALGVPDNDIDDLKSAVIDKVQAKSDEQLVADYLDYPAADFPDWKPFNVDDGLELYASRGGSV